MGEVNAVPNPLTNQSCLTGATEFLVTGVVVKATHCQGADSKTKITTAPTLLEGVPIPGASVKVCSDPNLPPI